MRPYFKNDLYNFTTARAQQQVLNTEEQNRKNKETKTQQNNKSKIKDSLKKTQPKNKFLMKVDDTLIVGGADKQCEQKGIEDVSQLLKSFTKKSSENKNILSNGYKPKSSLIIKQDPKPDKKTDQQIRQEQKHNNISFKRLERQIKQVALTAEKQGSGEQKQKQVKEGQKEQEQKEQIVENKQQGKSKTKKIKKQTNYCRLDLKRTYKDKFLGKLRENLRKYNRNGTLKPKYRIQSELAMQDGQLFNSYISSLSSALCMTLNLDDEDSDGQKSISQVSSKCDSPSAWDKESLTGYLKKVFGFEYFREGQFQTITNILNGKSTVFISETASGKSLTYIMSAMLLGGLSLVISPLVSLILDQLAHLPKDLPAACISSLINRQQKERIIKMVNEGKINLLFLTPECLQTDFIFHLCDFPNVNFTCIDQAHSLSELSHNFRTSFLALGDIVLNLIKYKDNKPTILGLTATANPETVLSIQQKLNIQQVIRSQKCMNKNLFVTISRERGSAKFQSLIRYLNDPLIYSCKGILIYTRTRKIMNQVYNYISNSTSFPVAIYHSALSNKEKTDTLRQFREGDKKIVIATIALGMGLDFAHLQCVIHMNMPKSIQNYVQQIGRAGRRQRRAYCHLFLDENDYITERNYIIADELQPLVLLFVYHNLKDHSVAKLQKKQTKEQEHLVVKRVSILLEQSQRKQQIIYQQQQQDVSEDHANQQTITLSKKKVNTKLFSMRVNKLTEATQLREQAILTLLLKIESLLKNDSDVKFKVLPVSNETIKIGYFKNNEEQIKSQYEFFRNLIYGCKKIKGTIYINLIDKCNKLGMRPLELLTSLYRIGNKHWIKIQFETPIFVWQFEGKKQNIEEGIEQELFQLVKRGFQKLESSDYIDRVVTEMNNVQSVSLTKLNILYSLAFVNSRNKIANILDQGRLLPHAEPIPENSISKEFDNYFRANLQEYYNKITDNEKEIYIPTTMIESKDIDEIFGCVTLFFKHEMSNLGELRTEGEVNRARRQSVQRYQNGKILTKILMGVNSGEVTWKIYGERSYWMSFKLKNYVQLLQVVRQQIQRYKRQYFQE